MQKRPRFRPVRSDLPFPSGVAFLLFALVAILTFWRYLYTGFTDQDSMEVAMRWWHGNAIWDWTRELAERQGRVGYFFAFYLNTIPYLLKSPWWFKSVTLPILAANAGAFYFALCAIFRSRAMAGMAVAVYLATVAHSINHSLLTGYFLRFHVSALLLMLSLAFLAEYLKAPKRSRLVWSTVCFALTMCREDSALYIAPFILLAGCHGFARRESGERRRALTSLAPHAVISGAYLGLTVGYRLLHPTTYPGNALDPGGFSLVLYARTLLTYGFSSFPGYLWAADPQYANLFAFYAGTSDGLPGLFASLRVEWVVRAILVFYLVKKMCPQFRLRGRRVYWGLGLAGLLMTLLPNMALSMTRQYQALALEGRRPLTHYTYFTSFGMALSLTWVAWSIWWAARRFGGDRGGRAVSLSLGAGFAFASLVADYTNQTIALAQSKSDKKWRAFEMFCETPAFSALAEGSLIYAPSLWTPVYMTDYYSIWDFSGGHLVPVKPDEPNYWEKYAEALSGKKVRITKEASDIKGLAGADGSLQERAYSLRFDQEDKESRQFLVFAKVDRIDPVGGKALADEAILYSYSPARRFRAMFNTVNPVAGATADGAPLEIRGVQASGIVDRLQDPSPLPATMLRARDIVLDSITVSYYLGRPEPPFPPAGKGG